MNYCARCGAPNALTGKITEQLSVNCVCCNCVKKELKREIERIKTTVIPGMQKVLKVLEQEGQDSEMPFSPDVQNELQYLADRYGEDKYVYLLSDGKYKIADERFIPEDSAKLVTTVVARQNK